jgi:micrococcal nuclease
MTYDRWQMPIIIAGLACLSGCIGVSGDVSPQGVDQAEVGLAVPLDRPYTFRRPEDQHLTSRAGFLRGQVVSVQKGDTLMVVIDGHTEKIGLIGIDVPEVTQAPWGTRARDALRSLVEGKTVRLETDIKRRDPDGRLLAYVCTGETLVNLELVRQGYAVVYTVPPNVAHLEKYQHAQNEAREAGRGVWDPEQPLMVSPSCFRNPQKGC